MPAIVTIIYPIPGPDDSSPFNMPYYLSTHMPMVQAAFGSHGMKSWQVVKADPSTGHDVMCTLEFEDMDQLTTAMTGHATEVLADVPNFTTVKSFMVFGAVVGGS